MIASPRSAMRTRSQERNSSASSGLSPRRRLSETASRSRSANTCASSKWNPSGNCGQARTCRDLARKQKLHRLYHAIWGDFRTGSGDIGHGLVNGGEDLHHLVEPGGGEDLAEDGTDLRQPEPALLGLDVVG